MPDRAVTTTRSGETALGQRLGGMTDPGFDRPEVHAEDALLSRRSIRSFEDKPVPNSLMRRILEAARWAPLRIKHTTVEGARLKRRGTATL